MKERRKRQSRSCAREELERQKGWRGGEDRRGEEEVPLRLLPAAPLLLRLTADLPLCLPAFLPAEPPRCRDVILKPNMSCAQVVARVSPPHARHCRIGDDTRREGGGGGVRQTVRRCTLCSMEAVRVAAERGQFRGKCNLQNIYTY